MNLILQSEWSDQHKKENYKSNNSSSIVMWFRTSFRARDKSTRDSHTSNPLISDMAEKRDTVRQCSISIISWIHCMHQHCPISIVEQLRSHILQSHVWSTVPLSESYQTRICSNGKAAFLSIQLIHLEVSNKNIISVILQGDVRISHDKMNLRLRS